MSSRRTGSVCVAMCVWGIGVAASQAQPQFDVLPQDALACDGAAVSFSVAVSFNGATNRVITWAFDDGTGGGFVPLLPGERVTIDTSVIADPATSVVTIDPTIGADDAGTYRCTATGDGTSASAIATLSFHDPPSTNPEVVFEGDFAGLCVGDSIGLMANPSGSDPVNQFVSWTVESGPNADLQQFSSFHIPNPDFTPFDFGTYVLEAVTDDDCGVGAGTITIEVFEPLSASPTPTDAATCPIVEVPLFANPTGGDGAYTFAWSVTPDDGSFFEPDATFENPTFTPLLATDYQVQVVVHAASVSVVCAQSPPVGVTVTVETTIAVVATADPPEFCVAQSSALGAVVTPPDGAFGYNWTIESGPDNSPGQFSDTNIAAPVFTPSSTTTADDPYVLRVLVSGGVCGSVSDTVTVTVNDPPTVAPTATPATVCVGHGSAMASNAGGSDAQVFVWSVDSGPDPSNGQFSPNWQAENPTFTPSAVGMYVLKVEVDDALCAGTVSETVAVEAAPVITAAPTASATTACVNSPVTLSANPSGGGGVYTFFWSVDSAPAGGGSDGFQPDATVESPSFTPTAVGTYVLEVVVGGDGCDDAAPEQVTIQVTSELAVTASASQSEFCLPDVTLLTAEPANDLLDYVWSVQSGPDPLPDQFGDPTAPITLFVPSTFGNYTLQVQVDLGGQDCGTSSDTVSLTVHDTPIAVVTAAQETLCLSGDPLDPNDTQLTVDTGGSGVDNQNIQWEIVSGPNAVPDQTQLSDANTANPTFTPTTSTSPGSEYRIQVSVFDPACGGIPLTDEIIITVHEALSASPSANPIVGCEGIAVNLSANASGGEGTYTFGWSVSPDLPDALPFDDTAENPTFTPSQGPLTYTMGLSVDDGLCVSTEPLYFVTLEVKAALSVAASAEFDTGVLGEAMTLHANATGGVAPTFSWTVFALPSGCTSDSPLTDATSADPTFLPGCLGTYTLRLDAVDTVCDPASDGLDIDVILFTATPSATPSSLCENGSATLIPNLNDNGAFGQFDFAWTIVDGSPDTSPLQFDNAFVENPVFTPSSVGVYTIQVLADDQDNALPDITAQFDLAVSMAAPIIDASPQDKTVCAGEPVTLTVSATGTDLSYQWNMNGVALTGETESFLAIQSVVFADAGMYTCDVSNGCGAVTSQPAELVVNPGLGLTLFVGTREDGVLREAEIVGCTVSGDLLDRGNMGETIGPVTGLAVDPNTGVLYAAVRHGVNLPETELATVNTVTGEASIIASMGLPIADLAFTSDGTLYAIRGNHPCTSCPGTGADGEMFTVDLTDASLTPLTPAVVLGDDDGHTITFDAANRLYHHGRMPNVYSRLTRRSLNDPSNVEILKEFDPDVSLTAMTLRDDLFLAARRNPSELWSLDHAGGIGTYDATVLGPFETSAAGDPTVLGMAFLCSVAGDADCDGDTDLTDYGAFVACVEDASAAACVAFDTDGDGDVDLTDWGTFQVAFTGSSGS